MFLFRFSRAAFCLLPCAFFFPPSALCLLPSAFFFPPSAFSSSPRARKSPATVNAHRRPGYPPGAVRRQEVNQVGHLFSLSHTAKRMGRLAVLEKGRVCLFIHPTRPM